MQQTTLMASVAKFASKSPVRPELACVLSDDIKSVATDSFKLVEISRVTGDKPAIPALYDAQMMKKAKVFTAKAVEEMRVDIDAGIYPDYEPLLTPRKGDRTMMVNAKYLSEVCAALSKIEQFGGVTLHIPENPNQAILFTASGQSHTARAALMPMYTAKS